MALTGKHVLGALGIKHDHCANIGNGSWEEQMFSLLGEDARIELDHIAKKQDTIDITAIPLTHAHIEHIINSGRGYFERGGMLNGNTPVGEAQRAALERFTALLGTLRNDTGEA
jgi:glyoxylase-like metal-dependent hydrolase (beta-lactamase superfamily II)